MHALDFVNSVNIGIMNQNTVCQKDIQLNLDDLNIDGSFTLDGSNSFLVPREILPIAQKQQQQQKKKTKTNIKGSFLILS